MTTRLRLSVIAIALTMAQFGAFAQTSNNAQGAQALTLTPRQTEGPYYPPQKPADRDNDLTRVGDGAPALGQVLILSGRLVDERNNPISQARIEIWQTDHSGIYMHPDFSGTSKRDRNFQFYGEANTDVTGRFTFRTVMPGVYGGRPRHLHVKIAPTKGSSLTTQLYFKGDDRLSGDRIVRGLGASLSTVLLDPEQRSPKELHASVTFVVRAN